MKVSVITPSFNQAAYLERTILSVINQNYPDIEYIIIDGGSDDGSIEIIKKYEKYLSYWISEKDNGQSDAINKGLKRASGQIVSWLNSDDYYEPETIQKVVDLFYENPEVGLIYGACNVITLDENGNRISNRVVIPKKMSEFSLLKFWRGGFLPPQPSIFWKKAIQDKTKLLRIDLNFAMDLDFWLQMSKHTKFLKTESVLSNYVIHQNSKSGSKEGFEKFVPEWREVTNEYLRQKKFFFRSLFLLNYYFRLILR